MAQGNGPSDKPPAPDILENDASSSGSRSSSRGRGSSSSQQMTCTNNMQQGGVLPLAKAWAEAGRVTLSAAPLEQGGCVAYKITPQQLAGTACATPSPDSYILVEFWQQPGNSSSSSSSSGGGRRSSMPDVRVLAARGTQPWITVGPDGHTKVTPPIRDPDTGLTPVGTFQDDAAVVYNRAAARVFFPTASPMTDMGEPLDPNTWYITVAVKPQEGSSDPLPGYGIRASCIIANPTGSSSSRMDTRRVGSSSSSSSSAAAALGDTTDGIPCPVASPGGPQCSGRGTCRVDSTAQSIERSRYCDCESGSGSYACQTRLPALPLNTATTVTVPPGQWGIWEVTLPGLIKDSRGGPGAPPRDAVAAAAAGLGPGLVGNEVLLVTAERVDREQGFGGNPLLFLKPFMTKDHNEPSLDALDTDVVQYADLRSFQLQLNRHFLLQRLPVRDALSPSGASGYSMPRRWYVAIYNSNATRLSQPARVELNLQYRDLNRSPLVCPFDCSGSGRCVDPKPASSALMPLDLGSNGPSDASIVTAIGPMQDQSPVDAGFMCVCNPGYAGLTCEGRMQNVTVGSGEQRLGPEVLQPGGWFFYVVTVVSGFNPQQHDLGIQWTIGEPSSPPSNYSGAFISFDQGPLPSHALGDRRLVIPVRKSMTPYSKLIVRNNPPLPLQVPGGQLSPGGTYVVSIFNNDYAVTEPFQFTLNFFIMADQGTFMHPYMSILLGVTAAVILCLAMTLCSRVPGRYIVFFRSNVSSTQQGIERALRSASDVERVVQDQIISIAQTRCIPPSSLAGISSAGPRLQWAGCKANGTRIYWFGERCGANLARTRWVGMYAVNTTTNEMIPGCLQYRKSPESDPWNVAHMGACGVAPTVAPADLAVNKFIPLGIQCIAAVYKSRHVPCPVSDLAVNEFIPLGIQRIEAVYKSRLPDMARAPVPGVVVAVVDTGVDASHPDLNVVGGMNFVGDEPQLTYANDTNGHGTHVSGTIGARNQGKGIVGVAPGIGIYALRVLHADGNGLLSDLLRAYDHLVANARQLGIRVVNLSLSGAGQTTDEDCRYVTELVRQGITVVTAAGNTGVSALGVVPAACPGALVVTAVSDMDGVGGSSDYPPSWSNFVPLSDTGNFTSRMLAAPGDDVTSTWPLIQPAFGGYAKMKGTSMACPHISGIAALCYASGVCKSSSSSELEKVVAPAVAYNQAVSFYGYNNDPLTNPLPDKYYGYMAWGRQFWGQEQGDWYPAGLSLPSLQ
ncbi:hypothetical protein OEZ85_012648 [Tetradesmus obliquus]|uniref:EGF-like domain-containing protein n=1 Tax=Tetradesmus obliquus TaxID=3088 RepID=A0ABY8U3E1_TETOB|nr:hypothetical protein OEZ85_012648 [Tetradesmus obliquus]